MQVEETNEVEQVILLKDPIKTELKKILLIVINMIWIINGYLSIYLYWYKINAKYE